MIRTWALLRWCSTKRRYIKCTYLYLYLSTATTGDISNDLDGPLTQFSRSRHFWSKLLSQQEAQLMLTNPRDAFRGQSRSPNIVPFHMLGIVSYCAIVTVFKTRRFYDIRLQKCRDLEIRVRGHSMSLKVVPLDGLSMVSY